jgi:putative DNA primase/helicase
MRDAMHYTVEDARDALQHLDPGCSHDEWVKLAMASKAAGLDLATFSAWSANGPSYSERDTRDLWKSAKPDLGIGAGSLFWAAKQAGWEPSDGNTTATPRKAPTRPIEAAIAPCPGMGATDVWDRCHPATAEHAYIAAKQGTPAGLRVVPDDDPLRIAGKSVAGWLVVPVVPLTARDPASLQFIPPPGAGGKLNLPHAKLEGMFVVGDLVTGGVVHVCEGIGQAWACSAATAHASVVTFGWGRMRAAAAEIRLRDPSAKIVLVPDSGKTHDAEAIARGVQASVAVMPDSWPRNSDVNDLCQRDGIDALRDLLRNTIEPPPPERRFRLLGSADLHALPGQMWRVRGVLPAQGLACVYGPSGSGKSFLVLDMAARVAEGGDWFGHRVTPAPVVYVCLEGAAGLRQRVQAWEQHHGRKLPSSLQIVVDPFKLTDPQQVTEMAAAVLSVGCCAVTFIDTLNATAPGIDENASRDMGTVLEAAKTLQATTGGLVAFVHHTGKDQGKGMRGHSSLVAAVDGAVEVSRDAKGRHWRIAKSKDGADGEAHPFTLDVIHLPPDSEGEAVSSCVVGAAVTTAGVKQAIQQAKVPSGRNQRLVFDGIFHLFKVSIAARPGVPSMRPSLDLETAVARGAACLPCASDKRNSRAREAIAGMVSSRILGLNDGWLWLPT